MESEFSAPAITITMSPPFVGILKMRGDARQRAVQHALASRLHAMEAAAAAAAAAAAEAASAAAAELRGVREEREAAEECSRWWDV